MLHDFFKLQFFRRFIYNELPISFKHMRLRNEARRNADQPLLRNHQEFPTQDFLLRKNSPFLATPASGAPSLMKTSRKPTAKPPLTLTLNFFICFINSVLNILIIDCCVLTALYLICFILPVLLFVVFGCPFYIFLHPNLIVPHLRISTKYCHPCRGIQAYACRRGCACSVSALLVPNSQPAGIFIAKWACLSHFSCFSTS